jgi:putative endonuclease
LRRVGWHVYIVRCADRTLYTGVAKDLPARIAAHNDGRGAKYTRPRLPVKLVYVEAAADRAAAQRREHAIKRLSRAAKRALCARSTTINRRAAQAAVIALPAGRGTRPRRAV